ncbi:MAG: metal ABC transporter permease [Candidatus Anstonellales archaeon]
MLELFSYTFMQYALVVGVIITVICSTLGLFLVLRRMSLIGDGLSHIAFGGIALGLFLNWMPYIMALLFSIFASLGIIKLRENARIYGDTAIGIVFSSALAFGVVLISISSGFKADWHTLLFGNIISVNLEDVLITLLIGSLVLVLVMRYYHQFLFLSFDEKSAQASGINTRRLNVLLIVLTAITVVISIRIVGILLVSSFLIIPPATALQVAPSFRRALIYSILFGLISLFVGLLASYYFDIASGGAIVLVSSILFFGAFLYRFFYLS